MYLHEAHIVFENPMAENFFIFFGGKNTAWPGMAAYVPGPHPRCSGDGVTRWAWSLPLLREVLGTGCSGIFVDLTSHLTSHLLEIVSDMPLAIRVPSLNLIFCLAILRNDCS